MAATASPFSTKRRDIPDKNSSTLLRGREHIDNVLDGFVGAVVCGFEPTVWTVVGVGPVVETAVGNRSAEAFMEEQEQQRHLDPLGSEAVGVTGAITFEQSVPLELAQVVAQLVEPVISIGEAEGGKNGLVDLLGGPATDMSTAVQENLA